MKVAASWFAIPFITLLGQAFAAGVYNLQDNVVGNGFYDFFGFETISDPTNGRVYVPSLVLC